MNSFVKRDERGAGVDCESDELRLGGVFEYIDKQIRKKNQSLKQCRLVTLAEQIM